MIYIPFYVCSSSLSFARSRTLQHCRPWEGAYAKLPGTPIPAIGGPEMMILSSFIRQLPPNVAFIGSTANASIEVIHPGTNHSVYYLLSEHATHSTRGLPQQVSTHIPLHYHSYKNTHVWNTDLIVSVLAYIRERCIALDMRGYPHNIFFYFSTKQILCVLIRIALGASNEYTQYMFSRSNKKIMSTFRMKNFAMIMRMRAKQRSRLANKSASLTRTFAKHRIIRLHTIQKTAI